LVVLATAIVIAGYLVMMHRSISRLRQMGQPQANLEVSDDRFRIISDLVTTELRWPLIQKIWCYESFWLVFFSRSESMIFPLEDLPEDIRDFIKNKVVENGGKVT
jgi:hypothetical protein